MKLLLADGTKVLVSSYENIYATIKGDTVPAVSFAVLNHTLDEVKTLFSNGENLDVLKLYTDEEILMETFTGYQVRKMISITDDEGVYTVVLAQTTETSQKLAAMEKTMTDVLNTVKEVTAAVNELKETENSLSENYASISEKVTKTVNDLKNVSSAVTSISSGYEAMQKTVENANATVENVNNNYAAFTNTLSEMSDTITTISNNAQTAVESAKQAVKTADTASLKSISMDESISGISQTLKRVGETSASASESVVSHEEKIKKINEDIATATESTKNAIESQNTTIEDVKKSVENAKADVKNVSEANSELSDRVAALEPINDITTLDLDAAKEYRVKESATALAEYLASHPITSTCHGGKEAQYSITCEKQQLLQSMIMVAQTAAQNNLDYQPSWNATGEVCSYDWTLTELCQLALEIETTVRPLVSHQQTIEKEIRSATSMDELVAIQISYNGISANPMPTVKQASTTDTDASSTDGEGEIVEEESESVIKG